MRSMFEALFRPFRRGPKPLANSEDATKVFLALFQGHGLPCGFKNGWIVGDSGCLVAQARVFTHSQTPALCSIQLDLEVKLPSGTSILESCAGLGGSLHSAIGDAIKNLCDGSFHVLFSAFTGQSCSHCEIETWEINGRSRRVFIGPMVARMMPAGELPSTDWFSEMTQDIKKAHPAHGLHWVRLYHAESPNANPTSEVLLDNQEWPELQNRMASYSWPKKNYFYSVRIFLVITDQSENEAVQS